MTDNPTREEVLASIVANSDQLNSEDLLTGPITVTITSVTRGTREQPIFIHMEGYKKTFRPCKTCRRILITTYSDDPAKWIGQRMTLFLDSTVVYAGVKVGGIRISHLSGLDQPKTFMLTQTRGKKAEVVIHPINALSEADQKAILDAKKQIAEAADVATLKGIGALIGKQSSAVKEGVRKVYEARLAELK